MGASTRAHATVMPSWPSSIEHRLRSADEFGASVRGREIPPFILVLTALPLLPPSAVAL